ncbi:MAG: FAD-binding oxidoreductase [Rhodobacteraceae bacterium]|nr:MAG: FAD-binding oxidoreductase [Paracoccaceae bacterium]
MPGPTVAPVAGDATLPEAVDVAVIGGGIIGCATALELAERGHSVALCEKGGIGAEQSSRNWGWVRISRRDPREVPLMAESIRLWEDLDRRVGGDTGYRQSGIVFLSPDDAAQAWNEDWLRNLDGMQMGGAMLSAAEVAARFPDLKAPAKGALHTRKDGRAEPQKAAPAVAEAARRQGAHILTRCAARVIETEGGAVSGVITERGRIRCGAVVVAGGAWSRLFLGNLGVDLPQLRVVNSVLRTEPLEGGPEEALKGAAFAVRKRADGGYTVSSTLANRFDLTPDAFRLFAKFLPALMLEWRTIGLRVGQPFLAAATTPRRWSGDDVTPFERTRVLDPAPDVRALDRVMARLREALPVFERAVVAQRWAGAIDVTPDALPVISGVDGRPGLFLATGFSGHGFGIGPGAGRLAADLVTGRAPTVDPAPFRFSRFHDGTALKPMVTI